MPQCKDCKAELFTDVERFMSQCNRCYFKVDTILTDLRSRVTYPTLPDDDMVRRLQDLRSGKALVPSFWLRNVGR